MTKGIVTIGGRRPVHHKTIQKAEAIANQIKTLFKKNGSIIVDEADKEKVFSFMMIDNAHVKENDAKITIQKSVV